MASFCAVVMHVKGTDPGNYNGTGRIVLGGAALGAIIGAAIGAGAERQDANPQSELRHGPGRRGIVAFGGEAGR